jgi:epoxyqueuosine reductase
VRTSIAPFALERFAEAVLDLESEGLNWLAYARAIDGPVDSAVAPHQGVLLFLGMGGAFGDRTRIGSSAPNPFDERARSLVLPFIEDRLLGHDPDTKLVYPSSGTSVNLMAWLAGAKAQYPSRLGIGIRPDCGTWFAVRAAVATNLPGAAESWLLDRYPALDPDSESPCARCDETPCVRACPATAIDTSFHLLRCVEQRLSPDSACAPRCDARLACPVGSNFRYGESQVAYHYGVSLKMLQRWRNGN